MNTCFTCKWFSLDPSRIRKDGRPKDWNETGRCDWPVPPITLADSITQSAGFYGIGTARTYVSANHTGCPTWEAKP